MYSHLFPSHDPGRYVKIGRLVLVTGYFGASANNNANTSQTLLLSGLPFTVGANENTYYTAGAIGYYTSCATSSGGVPVYYFAVNDDVIVFQQSGISTSDVQGFPVTINRFYLFYFSFFCNCHCFLLLRICIITSRNHHGSILR